MLLAQKFMPTEFDWRVGVLGGEPLFAASTTWRTSTGRSSSHDANGSHAEGGHSTFPIEEAPRDVIDIAPRRAAADRRRALRRRPQGDARRRLRHRGQRQSQSRPRHVEDSGEKDEVWVRLTQWFLDRLERQGR
jgi:hypothetical protein